MMGLAALSLACATSPPTAPATAVGVRAIGSTPFLDSPVNGKPIAAFRMELVDGEGRHVDAAGIAITAGTSWPPPGLLEGTRTRVTNSSGIATFDDLSPLGPAGGFDWSFSAPGLQSALYFGAVLPPDFRAVLSIEHAIDFTVRCP